MKALTEIEINKNDYDFIIKDLIKLNGLYLLVGEAKVGKSFFTLQLANAITNGNPFLGFETKASPVLYIGTEITESELKIRSKIMQNEVNNNLFIETNEYRESKISITDLEEIITEFISKHDGKFVVIDMFKDIDFNFNYDIRDYQDMSQKTLFMLRNLCKKGISILIVHHLNKTGSPLGSIAFEGSVDGIFKLKSDNFDDKKFYLKYTSRHFKEQNIVLKKEETLNLSVDNSEDFSLNPCITKFLNHIISQKNSELSFIVSEITSTLFTEMRPADFGKLMHKEMQKLERLGLHIKSLKSSKERRYHAKYEEPIEEMAEMNILESIENG